MTRQNSGTGPFGFLVWIALLAIVVGASGCGRLQARLQLKNGNKKYLTGEYQTAIQHYDNAIRIEPRYAPAYLNKAYSEEALFRIADNAEQKKKLAADAVDSFEKYLDLLGKGAVGVDDKGPNAQRVEEHILTLLVDSDQFDQAIAYLQGRLDRDPRDTSALEMLSRLEMEHGRWDEALDWQRKRLALEPDNPDAQYSMGAFIWLYSYRNTALDRDKRDALLAEGTAALQRAIELRPNDFESLIYINLLYLEKAKYTDDETEKAALQAKAEEFRNRALALRKAAAGDSTGGAAAAPAQTGAAETPATGSATDPGR